MSIKYIIGMLLILAASVCIVGSATDYSGPQKLLEQNLVELTPGIFSPNVYISERIVEVDYRSYSATGKKMVADMASVMGGYWAIVLQYPEVGDLKATLRAPNGDLVGTYRCEKEWLDGKDPENDEDMVDLFYQVTQTIKTVRS